MADEQLTALPAASDLAGTEVVYGVQSSASVKISANQIKAFSATTPGGSAGQVQWNSNGAFGGFDVSGDGTLDTSTGVLTITAIGGAPFSSSYVAKTGAYNVGAGDFVVDCTANTFTVTLPTAVGVDGKQYCIKNSGTGVITIATTSAQTIDGAANKKLSVQYESFWVISDGVNWKVI
jgi:hypothetical protein